MGGVEGVHASRERHPFSAAEGTAVATRWRCDPGHGAENGLGGTAAGACRTAAPVGRTVRR
jgi:hypothetical protein